MSVRILVSFNSVSGRGGVGSTPAGKEGTFSFWADFSVSANIADQFILQAGDTTGSLIRVEIIRLVGSKVRFTGTDKDGNVAFIVDTATAYPTGLHHYLVSWDTAQPIVQVRVDGVEDADVIALNVDVETEYGLYQWYIGSNDRQGENIVADLGELFFHNKWIDIDDSSNVLKFFSDVENPAALGASGQLPFGELPVIYITGTPRRWNTVPANNRGTGDDFAVVSAPTIAEQGVTRQEFGVQATGDPGSYWFVPHWSFFYWNIRYWTAGFFTLAESGFEAAGEFKAAASIANKFQGSIDLVGAGSLVAAADIADKVGTVDFAGVGTLAATGNLASKVGAIDFVGAGEFKAKTFSTIPRSVDFVGVGTLTVTPTLIVFDIWQIQSESIKDVWIEQGEAA